jgi:uncharacterized protein (TIGR02391 family)
MSDRKSKEIVDSFLKNLDQEIYDKEKKKAEELYDKIITHSQIREASRDLFLGENYRNAVLDAMIKIEEMVKKKAKYPKDHNGKELSGRALMFRVFNSANPLLKWSRLQNQAEKDELEGYCQIFAGAMLGVRNPKAHTIFRAKPMRALQLLHFATLLAEIVDASK